MSPAQPGASPAFTPGLPAAPQSCWPLSKAQPSALPLERLLAAHTHHVGGQLVPRQVLDILVLRVDDVREPPAAHLLLQHPHVHLALEAAQPSCVAAGDLGDGRAPARAEGGRGGGHRGAQGTTGHAVTCRNGDGWHRLPAGDRAGQGTRVPGAHQLPEPTTQTFLPPMVPGAGRCGLEPASAISGLPGAGAAPARPRPRLAAGPRAPLRARQVQSAALEQLRSPRTRRHAIP